MLQLLSEYSFAGDFFAIIICISCVSVLRSSYTMKQANLTLYYLALIIISCSSIQSMGFHAMLDQPLMTKGDIFIFFSMQNSVLIGLQVLLLVMLEYLMNLFYYSRRNRWHVRAWTWSVVLLYGIYKFYTPLHGLDIHVDPITHMVKNWSLQDNIYFFIYAYLFCWCVGIIFKHHKQLITHVYRCLTANAFLAFIIMILSYVLNLSTFICISFTLPVLAVLFLFHYNAYDVKMGTLDLKAFRGYMSDIGKKDTFVVISLYLRKNPIDKNERFSQNFLQYMQSVFPEHKQYNLFRISDEHFILIFNTTHVEDLDGMLSLIALRIEYGLKYIYKHFGVPYQLLYIKSTPELKDEDYVNISQYLADKMPLNKIRHCSMKDIINYQKYCTIDAVFKDIQKTNNYDDERVIVYYQPIFDQHRSCYKAEALMRLQVGDTLYSPADFLPVVENENYSHLITKIMLHKVCRHLKVLEQEGYDIRKISINASTADLLVNDGYRDFIDIVENHHHLTFDQIAFEILEYTDSVDYEPLVKTMTAFSVISGIEFYLDDFGSGYSNLLRLLSLPVKIIKFDRDILRKIHDTSNSLSIVKSNIETFRGAGYEILFEGVETAEDIAICEELGTDYFQGYFFAKPGDFETLKTYLMKKLSD